MRLSIACVALVACSSSNSGDLDGPRADANPNAPDARPLPDAPPQPTLALALQPVATGLSNPLVIVQPPGETRLFVAQKGGKVVAIENGIPRAGDPVIDISATVSGGSEQGLLGLAFHPQFATNGLFYVYFSGNTQPSGETARPNYTHVWEYHATGDHNSTDRHRVILDVTHEDTNHNGGNIVFGPDGKLYIGIGDGGGGFDSNNHSRFLNTRMSKLLRIDINHDPYQAPTDNPFYNMAVADDPTNAHQDIWFWGLRNPWRWSFDRMTGDLWIGDVGQNCFEEIDVAPAGQKGLDFGWNIVEGIGHKPVSSCASVVPATQPGAVVPVLEYDHSKGNAVVGGYVYRGVAIPEINGLYFFSDNGTGFIRTFWANAPVHQFNETKSWSSLQQGGLSTFGEDAKGEILICSFSGQCSRIVKGGS